MVWSKGTTLPSLLIHYTYRPPLSFRSYEMDDELAIREWQRIEARTVSNAT